MRLIIKSITRKIKALFFPRGIRCVLCGAPIRNPDGGICHNCKKTLPTSSAITLNIPGVDSVSYAFFYQPPVSDMIKKFKYNKHKFYAHFFAKRISLLNLAKVDAIIPVPTHKDRVKKRGFCHTTELAIELSKITGIPLATGKLVRTINTIQQARISKDERLKNLIDAFSAQDLGDISSVILLDDVITTGSTLAQCARTLREAGITQIHAVSVAHTNFSK